MNRAPRLDRRTETSIVLPRLRRRRAGFTLVELMVSLAGGLIIAMAVVGLARTATRTFYEQVRLTAVESSLRSASDRLRNDLIRTAFMSTGNVKFDPGIAHLPSAATYSRYSDTDDLQGIRLTVNGSKAATQGSDNKFADRNSLSPDDIILGGNFTTDDSYRAQWQGTGTGSCAGPRFVMTAAGDAATARLLSASSPGNAVKNAFLPIANKNFIMRAVDAHGCAHFVEICSATGTATNATIIIKPPNSGNAILSDGDTKANCGGADMQEFSISPVHRVRWYLARKVNTTLDNGDSDDDNKFDLFRDLLDASGKTVDSGGNAVAPAYSELVAEYAIDMKFGIVVDDPTKTGNGAARLSVYDLDSDADGTGMITKYTTGVSNSSIVAGQPGPQRIRALRYRLSMRAALPDRTTNLSLVSATSPYISRYCLDKVDIASCTRFARVRTLVSEVALTNQAKMSF